MRKLFFPFILCAFSLSAWAADGKFALQRGQSVSLALPDKPTATELFAAEELSRYLGLLLDVQTTTVPWGSSEAI